LKDQNTIVIGGGLAGIAAAVKLAQAGVRVTLVETRKRLGGRATSFVDPATGQVLDNCQHVLLRCCTNLIDLYKRLGVADKITWHKTLYFMDAKGTMDMLEPDDLPAPLHLTGAFLKFKQLSWLEKFAISKAMASLMRLGAQGRKAWHNRSFADWLRHHNQPPGAVRKYWENIAVSALNEHIDRMAADYAIQVFQEGFCASEDASAMGLPNVPLVQLYDAAQKVIEDAGGKVVLGGGAEALNYDGKRITSLQLSGARWLEADHFISAVPFDRLAKLCDPRTVAADKRLQGLNHIRVSPIIGIHVWFKDEVMDLPHLVLTESPLHWIFNKGIDARQGGQHLHGVISAAHDLIDAPAAEIEALVIREIQKAIPKAQPSGVRYAKAIKEKRATFAITPGIDALRPTATGDIENLILAGDWCQSGWPATMEGATRSGYIAAGCLLNEKTNPESALVANMPNSPLYDVISS